jgi:acyl-CoA thioesterase
MTKNSHPLDLAVHLEPVSENLWQGHTQPAYGNMVGPFGGITAAVLLNAVLKHAQRLGDPVSLTVNFAGPIEDGAFTIAAQPTRTNRSTQHWSITLFQHDGQIATTASAVFAVRRETWQSTELSFPDKKPALTLARADTSKAPEWTRRYDMRPIKGLMIDGQQPEHEPDAVTEFWIQDVPPRPLDFLSLTAICDSFVPRIFVRKMGRYPAGTISLTTYFHADTALLSTQGSHHVLGLARATRFGLGYHDQSAEIWSDQQQLLATSHQVVYFKA